MDAGFWHDKWAKNDIAFHQSVVHPMLTTYLAALKLEAGARVFVPLCGKSLDMAWLANEGCHVIGSELSETAARQFFADAGLEPKVSDWAGGKHLTAQNVEIYVGDIFDLTADVIGSVQATYDRAALVALPETMRQRYTDHVTRITLAASQLLITFTYDQSAMAGPPFSIPDQEVKSHYSEQYRVRHLCSDAVQGGLKGKVPALEHLWLLTPISM